jgi:hypothetical protein
MGTLRRRRNTGDGVKVSSDLLNVTLGRSENGKERKGSRIGKRLEGRYELLFGRGKCISILFGH